MAPSMAAVRRAATHTAASARNRTLPSCPLSSWPWMLAPSMAWDEPKKLSASSVDPTLTTKVRFTAKSMAALDRWNQRLWWA